MATSSAEVTLLVKEDSIAIESEILTSQSSVFNQMINEDQLVETTLDLTEFDREAVWAVMDVLRGRTVPHVRRVKLWGFNVAARIVRRRITANDVLTKDNFQQFNKICISFKLQDLETQCVQYFEKICQRLYDNVEASLTDAQFLFNQTAYVMKEAWGSRDKFIAPLKLKLGTLPALRRALLDAYIEHHESHDWVASELMAILVEHGRYPHDDVVRLYTWFTDLIQTRDSQPLTLGERSILRHQTLAVCFRHSQATYDPLIKTLADKAIDVDVRFVMFQISNVSMAPVRQRKTSHSHSNT